MIERVRKFAVLVGLLVYHGRRFFTGQKASICADNSLLLVPLSMIMSALLMRYQQKLIYSSI